MRTKSLVTEKELRRVTTKVSKMGMERSAIFVVKVRTFHAIAGGDSDSAWYVEKKATLLRIAPIKRLETEEEVIIRIRTEIDQAHTVEEMQETKEMTTNIDQEHILLVMDGIMATIMAGTTMEEMGVIPMNPITITLEVSMLIWVKAN